MKKRLWLNDSHAVFEGGFSMKCNLVSKCRKRTLTCCAAIFKLVYTNSPVYCHGLYKRDTSPCTRKLSCSARFWYTKKTTYRQQSSCTRNLPCSLLTPQWSSVHSLECNLFSEWRRGRKSNHTILQVFAPPSLSVTSRRWGRLKHLAGRRWV